MDDESAYLYAECLEAAMRERCGVIGVMSLEEHDALQDALVREPLLADIVEKVIAIVRHDIRTAA